MYGKFLLYSTFAAAEFLELFEDNYERVFNKYFHGCLHHNKDEELCGCWDCEDCKKTKKCLTCAMEEQRN